MNRHVRIRVVTHSNVLARFAFGALSKVNELVRRWEGAEHIKSALLLHIAAQRIASA